jgi:glycogen(starch) synthase
MPKRIPRTSTKSRSLLIEVAWEVCNQVGGIYTVIRSKAPEMMQNWSGHFCMVGPYVNKNILAELEPLEDAADVFGQAAANLTKEGIRCNLCRVANYRKA